MFNETSENMHLHALILLVNFGTFCATMYMYVECLL